MKLYPIFVTVIAALFISTHTAIIFSSSILTSPVLEEEIKTLESSASTEQKASSSNLETQPDCNFLFTYYKIDPIAKLIPREVQYMICSHLVDQFVGVFVFDKPAQSFEDPGDVTACAFNNAGTMLAYRTRPYENYGDLSRDITTCMAADVGNSQHTDTRKLFTVPWHLDESHKGLVFSPDDTRLLYYSGHIISEGKIGAKDEGQEMREILGLQDFLQAKADAQFSVNQGILAAGYAKDCSITFVTEAMQIVQLNKDPNEPATSLTHKSYPQFKVDRNLCAAWDASLNSDCSRAFFRTRKQEGILCTLNDKNFSPSFNLVVNGYDTHKSSNTKSTQLALNDDIIAFRLEMVKPRHEVVAILNIPTTKCIATFYVPLKDHLRTVCLTSNSKLLLMSGFYFFQLYHLPSQRLIGHRKYKSCKGSFSELTTFNQSGNVFAHIRSNKSAKKSKIDLWQINSQQEGLEEALAGRFTLEQYLFCQFLRELNHKKLSLKDALPSLSQEHKTPLVQLKNHFKGIMQRSTPEIKRYFYFLMARSIIDDMQ